MPALFYVPFLEFQKIRFSSADPFARARLFADLCRVNTLCMIMQAGSGHIGSSFSSLDIVSWLYLSELRLPPDSKAFLLKEHDIYFSSKGHDVPGLYSVLIGLGFLEESYLDKLRCLEGLPGHPDIATPFIEANTGSLGMGLSKAKGMALANRLQKKQRKIFVLTGDGEWQEGQLWEAMAGAAHLGLHEITLVVDHNKIQSDIWVDEVSPLGDLKTKAQGFGWNVFECDGHDFKQLSEVFERVRRQTKKPKLIIADTVKGKGVSFMEGSSLKSGERLYLFHSGAPDFGHYQKALKEIKNRIDKTAAQLGLERVGFKKKPLMDRPSLKKPRRLIEDYSRILVKAARKNPKLVALDADLAKDCGLLSFEKEFPGRFIECGIAEQDMVSLAGGLALQGITPVVHSFASFLSARPNEQFYNNASEKTKIIYVGSLAGLLPAAPGHSHQAVRDISTLGAIPGLVLIQPCCAFELEKAFGWALEKNRSSTYLRLSSIPWEIEFNFPKNSVFTEGRGTLLAEGKDALIISYGPVLLSEASKARALLKKSKGIGVSVVNLPWLNTVDRDWLKETAGGFSKIFTLDDHLIHGGQGQMLASEINALGLPTRVIKIGVEGIPVCGRPQEVLRAHGLDARSLSDKIGLELTAG